MIDTNVRRALLALGAALLPLLLTARIWAVCTDAASGARLDWTLIGTQLTILSVLVILGVVCFVVSLIEELSTSKTTSSDDLMATPEVAVIAVIKPPTRKPLIGRQTSTLLVGAGVAGLAGALLASFIMKRRG